MKKAIVLAAGEGTRMKSAKSKVLHTLLGQPMLSYVMDAVRGASFEETIIICGRNEEALKGNYHDEDIAFVRQPIGDGIPYGTGYAVMCAEQHLQGGPVLIMAGDVPLVTAETLRNLLAVHENEGYVATVLTAELEDLTGYGRIIKNEEGLLTGIVEDRDCTPEQKKIREVNSGIFIIDQEKLKESLSKLTTDNDQNEYYVTDVFGVLAQEHARMGTMVMDDANEILGINSKVQLAMVENLLRKRITERHMTDGVIIENPETVVIGPKVKIGMDTRIEQNVRLVGETTIGADCVIGQGTVIRDCQVGDGVHIRSSELEESIVHDGVTMGPFAHLRPKAELKERVHLGNFVEVKNAVMGEGSKAGHLAYIGDADIGKDVNIGCGVVFVNYDGKKKHRATIHDHSFIGSNANIVAPVTIGERAYVAAGSTITKDIEPGALALERAEQKVIAKWVDKKFGAQEE